MEPGFHFGYPESVAVALALVIVIDWAALRYGGRAPLRGSMDAQEGSGESR